MVLYLVAENYVQAKNVKRHTFIIKISIVNQLLPWRKVSLWKALEIWAFQQ